MPENVDLGGERGYEFPDTGVKGSLPKEAMVVEVSLDLFAREVVV